MKATTTVAPKQFEDWFSGRKPNGFAAWGAELALGKRWPEAALAFELAVAAKPDEPRYIAALGSVYHKLDRLSEAKALYERAIGLGLGSVQVWTNLGEAALELLDFGAAAKALKQAVALDPKAKTPAGVRARALINRAKELLSAANKR